MGSPLLMFPSLLNLHRILIVFNTSVSWLASYKVLLLSSINVTVVQCNSFNPEMFYTLQNEDIHDSVLLTNHLLVLRSDLQKTPIGNDDLIWFRDSSYLKDEQGYYWTGYVITFLSGDN